MHKTDVSSIHLCHRCPRLLAYQLRGDSQAWRIGLTGSGSLPGKLFHDEIAAPFYKTIACHPGSPISKEFEATLAGPRNKLEMGILSLLEKHFFLPVMRRRSRQLGSAQILQLGLGFERWSRHVAQFVERVLLNGTRDPGKRLREVFHDPEHQITATYKLNKDQRLQVSGRYDALLFDIEAREAVLMEFKGRKASQADEDFLQLVLYAWLLKEAIGIIPRGVVFYLEEEEPEVCYSAENIASSMTHLRDLFRQVLSVIEAAAGRQEDVLPYTPDPALCKVCKYDARCDQDWGSRRDDTFVEATQQLDRLIETLESLKLPAEPVGYIAGPRFIRLKIKPALEQGVTVRRLCNQTENLQVMLHLLIPPLIQPQPGHVSVDIPRKTWVPLTLGEVWRLGQQTRPASVVAFPIGMTIDGSIVWADLSDSTMTSILVGGTAGSGKSMFLRSAIIGLALNATPQDLQLILIDPKRVSFTDLSTLPYLACPPLMDPAPAMEWLHKLINEMEDRYRLFESYKVPDLTAYNGLGKPLPHQVVLIDEYADLMIDKKTRERLEISIVRLAQKGRAAGIHLILATQRPDSKVVTPLIKANLQLKVALKVTTGVNSKVILDETGAEYLIGNGDMLIGGSVPLQRVQGALVTKTEIDRVIQNACTHPVQRAPP